MVATSAPPGLSKDALSLFYTVDTTLSNAPILVFYGSTSSIPITTNSTSLRIQSHVFTPAGLHSYHRLVVAPNSPFYDAVAHLSREEQGDEVCRAIAFSLFKYFSELPDALKRTWIARATKQRPTSESRLFTQSHAAELASRMVRVYDAKSVIADIEAALASQSISYIDVDLVLPPGTINHGGQGVANSAFESLDARYGTYARLIKLFGDSTFLPSSKVRRAPSRATTKSRSEYFSKIQKENLRREMCELVDTEESYVSKLHELVNSVAKQFREKARHKAAHSNSPDEDVLDNLFPPSLDQILQVNTDFFHATRALLEATENEAIEDIQTTLDSSVPQVQLSFDTSDPTGSLAIANCLLAWFPRFEKCYGAYILAQQEFSHVLRASMRDQTSSFASRIHETGEQRLMSMLIEPVQRLPRYSLYIDNIVKQLPAKHLALSPFLRAKDIIAEICSQDSDSSQHSKILRIFRQLIPSWPSAFRPQGRLVTAIDVYDVNPPFTQKAHPQGSKALVLVLFVGSMVLLEKASTEAISARSLLAETENPNTAISTSRAMSPDYHSGLIFAHGYSTMQIGIGEMSNNSFLRLSPLSISSQCRHHIQNCGASLLTKVIVLSLEGAFEGKASRFAKEIIKARIEGRFPDEVRDSQKWEVRQTEPETLHLSLFTAIFEDGMSGTEEGPFLPAPIRMTVGKETDVKSLHLNKEGISVAVAIADRGEGFYDLEVDAVGERRTRDIVTATDFLPVLSKRLGNLMQLRNTIRNPLVTTYLMQHNEDILNSLNLGQRHDQQVAVKQRSLRAPSPVKMLSNFFSGAPSKEYIRPPAPSRLLFSETIPHLAPPVPPKVTVVQPEPLLTDIVQVADRGVTSSVDVMADLEKTLSNYVLALRARKGNVVGRVVTNRAHANDAAVNDLYNSLLENPMNHEKPAQAPVDVLFASFEKFLNHGWKDKFGPLIDASTLRQMQTKSEILGPLEYDEYVTEVLGSASPQNRRALEAVLDLLADLMKGTTNDADRGGLTAALVDMIVNEPQSYKFIPIFDHLISDREVVLERGGRADNHVVMQSSLNSSSRHDASYPSGSLGSKASSLSRRLGFGSLRRENSKVDGNKSSSTLRSAWSRTALVPDANTKSSILRTKSVDLGNNSPSQYRLQSRDRTHMSGLSEQLEPDVPKTGRSHEENGQSRPRDNEILAAQKKKRRSSLSDLNELLQKPGATPLWMSSKPRAIPRPPQKSPPTSQTQSPTKAKEVSVPTQTKAKEATIQASFVPVVRPLNELKENRAPLGSRPPTFPQPRTMMMEQPTFDPFNASNQVVMGVATAGKPVARSPSGIPRNYRSPSAMPIRKGVLSERIASGNTPPPPVPAKGSSKLVENVSPTKTSLHQSPSKLDERLQAQQVSIAGTKNSLETELFKIGEELSALRTEKPAIHASTNATTSGSPQRREQQLITNLSTRLRALETKVPHLIGNLERQTGALESDYKSSMQVSQRHVRGLEAKLREATAENQALYARCDKELENVFAQVNLGQGGAAMQAKLNEALHDASRWRKLAQKLTRENIELKAMAGKE